VGWDVRLRNLDQPSGLREAPEGASSRGSTASLQVSAFRQNFGADGLAAARRLGYAALPISKPF